MSAAVLQVAENLWQQYAANINQGAMAKIVIDPMVGYALGDDGISFIAERFKSMIQAPVTISGGGHLDFTIVPSYNSDGRKEVTAGEVKSKTKSKKNKVARPPNAFILYRQHHHGRLVDANPGVHNYQISIILGQQWQQESAETKAQFKSMAEDIKKKHLHAHPNYQYQPRKPAEKKRRMTRRKAEQSQAQGTSATGPASMNITVPDFEHTDTGNAVFTLGNDDLGPDALATMVDEHNKKLTIFARPFWYTPTPVAFHETTAETQDDINFYANLLNLDTMYPVPQGQLSAEEQAILDGVTSRGLHGLEQHFDAHTQGTATSALARMSSLWSSDDAKDTTVA